MTEVLLSNESVIYAYLYFGVLGIVATWEGLAPRRALTAPLRTRWLHTFAVYLTDLCVLRLLFPLLAVGVALFAQERGWGLFNLWPGSAWFALAVSMIAIDVSHYVQHYLLHHVPPLWRIHRMHHTDRDYDFTTGLRFHPFESVFTIACDVSLILALGAPPLAVIAYEFLYVVVSLVAHGNVRMPLALDGALRLFVVTPDLHRVHHSARETETNSNFGAVVPWWDRLLGTYVSQPTKGHEGMEIGLSDFRDHKHLTLWWMIANPFLRTPSAAERGRSASSQDSVPVSSNELPKLGRG